MIKFIIPLFFAVISFTCYSQNISALRQHADAGSAEAQYQLGEWYCGNHSQSNFELALKYLRASAKQDNQEAINLIHKLTSHGYEAWGKVSVLPYYDLGIVSQDIENGLLEYISKGNADASLLLANSYFLQGNYTKAVGFYNKTLELINPDRLGTLSNESGESEQLEPERIILDAFSHLGYCYENGLGVNKDLMKAIAFFEFYGGYEETPNPNICRIIKELLMKYNNPALNEYVDECGGQFYDGLNGIGFDDPTISRPWRNIGVLYLKIGDYKRATDNIIVEPPHTADNGWQYCGCPIQYLWSGEMYYKGLGVTKDYEKAFNYFNIVVSDPVLNQFCDILNNYPDIYADACYRLYECYAYGRGVSVDKSKAQVYFKEALRFGSSSALYDDQKRYEILL